MIELEGDYVGGGAVSDSGGTSYQMAVDNPSFDKVNILVIRPEANLKHIILLNC